MKGELNVEAKKSKVSKIEIRTFTVEAKVNIEVKKEGKWYVIKDNISKIATQGKTEKQAHERLCEALSLYYEDYLPKLQKNPNIDILNSSCARKETIRDAPPHTLVSA